MYVRAKTVRHRDTTYEYLQLVEARREAGRNRQRAIATLGRLDQIAASGQLDQLIAGLARFSQHLRVVSVDRADGFAARTAKSWGPALVFGRLWGRQGLPGILERLTARPQLRRRAGGLRARPAATCGAGLGPAGGRLAGDH